MDTLGPIQGSASGELITSGLTASATPYHGLLPQAHISAPASDNWHLIHDDELSKLSAGHSAYMAAAGYSAAGAAFGLVGPFLTALTKLVSPMATSYSLSEVFYLVGFSGMVALAAVCLAVHFHSDQSSKRLAAQIRARPKHGG